MSDASRRREKTKTDATVRKTGVSFFARKRVLIPLATVAVLVVIGFMYYAPLKILYREARQERVLREQLVAVQQYNATVKQEIVSLETTEGAEDYARSQLGLVKKGDHMVVVLQGGKRLSIATKSRERQIQELEVTAQPFGIWTPFLDALFQIR